MLFQVFYRSEKARDRALEVLREVLEDLLEESTPKARPTSGSWSTWSDEDEVAPAPARPLVRDPARCCPQSHLVY